MNKEDISKVKKQIKVDPSHLALKDIVSVYIKKDSEEIFHAQHGYFEMFDEEEKAQFVKTFKKVLTGAFNKKIFELRFDEDADAPSVDTFREMLDTNSAQEFASASNDFVQKIIDNNNYDTDVVIHIVRCEYETQEQTLTFLLGSVNKIEKPKGEFTFNDMSGEYEVSFSTSLVVNMTSPMDGFMYPVVEDDDLNVNKILNYHSKNNKTNTTFIVDVLNCNLIMTAQEEKDLFNQILKEVLGSKVKPKTLHKIYSVIYEMYRIEEDEDDRLIERRIVQQVLDNVEGIELRRDLEEVYEEFIGQINYEFKVDNVIPDFSKKSVQFENSDTEVNIKPDSLDKVRPVRDENGNVFLLLEVGQDMSTEGINIDSDDVETIKFEDIE